MNPDRNYPLVLRYDHIELDNGRIQKHIRVRVTTAGDVSARGVY